MLRCKKTDHKSMPWGLHVCNFIDADGKSGKCISLLKQSTWAENLDLTDREASSLLDGGAVNGALSESVKPENLIEYMNKRELVEGRRELLVCTRWGYKWGRGNGGTVTFTVTPMILQDGKLSRGALDRERHTALLRASYPGWEIV